MTDPSEPDRADTANTEALERSQEAIDEGHAAAREALDDYSPTSEVDIPGTGEGLEADDDDEVAPRPN